MTDLLGLGGSALLSAGSIWMLRRASMKPGSSQRFIVYGGLILFLTAVWLVGWITGGEKAVPTALLLLMLFGLATVFLTAQRARIRKSLDRGDRIDPA